MTQPQTHEEMCKEYAAQKLKKAKFLSELNRKKRDLREIEAFERDIEKYNSLNK